MSFVEFAQVPLNPSSLEVLSARRHQRHNCDIPVSWQLPGRKLTGHSRLLNLGLGGACLELPFAITGPEPLELCFTLDDGATITLNSRIIWSSGDEDVLPRRTGVQFQSMSDDARRSLDAFLQRVAHKA
ncbi:MAG: PilZ domain-containing protein [Planctomycetes bacterium]|nr:PilZ domain-containing protein [Planctomycetota bacterium]